MSTRPDPNTPEAPQKATDGRQSAPQGSSGHRETPEGENGRETGAQSFQAEQQPRGPVGWARRYAAERQAQARITASTAPAAASHPLVRGRCPACRGASLFLGTGGYVTCARLDCPDPCAADKVLHGEQAAPREHCGELMPTAISGARSECVLRPGHSGSHADATGARWWINADPSIRECADADRRWPLEKHGE